MRFSTLIIFFRAKTNHFVFCSCNDKTIMLTFQIEYKQSRLTTAAATTTMVATTPFGQNSGWRGRLAQFSSRVREQSNTKWKHWQASTNLHPEPFLLLRSRLIKNIVNWRKYLTKFRWFLFGKSQHKTYVANTWGCKNNVPRII